MKSVRYKFIGVSDHAAMMIKMGINLKVRGGGLWCLNSSLLKEDAYRKSIDRYIKCEMESPLFNYYVCEWWKILKEKIKIKKV